MCGYFSHFSETTKKGKIASAEPRVAESSGVEGLRIVSRADAEGREGKPTVEASDKAVNIKIIN